MYFLTVTSMVLCTRVSIGWTISGMQPRPMAVVSHLREASGMCEAFLASRCSDKAQIRLMVKPGMITDANDCHSSVSTAA